MAIQKLPKAISKFSDDELIHYVAELYALPKNGSPKTPLTEKQRMRFRDGIRKAALIGQCRLHPDDEK